MYIEVRKTKNDIINFTEEIKKIEKSKFRIICRKKEEKNPFNFLHKIEYDVEDMIKEI